MRIKKKGQLTIFIILGILLLIIGAFFIYTRLSSSEQEIQTETSISQETALDALPVQRYIEDCLDNIAKGAVEKIGLQGGALYSEDGTTLRRSPGLSELQGDIYLRYNIREYMDPFSNAANLSNLLPLSLIQNHLGEFIAVRFTSPGRFVDSSSPPKPGASNCVDQLVNKRVFEAQGLKAEADFSSAEINVALLDSGVGVLLTMPTRVEILSTGDTATFREFSVHIPIRLKRVWEFSNKYIQRHLLDDRLPDPEDGIKAIDQTPPPVGTGSLVTVTDEKSPLEGRNYEFKFLVEKPITSNQGASP